MLAPKQAAPPSQAIGPYRLLGVIAEGGMAIVYRAERAGTREPVALKTVRVPHASHLAGIRREIQALLHLRHPGIVRVLDEGVEGGLPWYTMELLEGRTLDDEIRAAWGQPIHRLSQGTPERFEEPFDDAPSAQTGIALAARAPTPTRETAIQPLAIATADIARGARVSPRPRAGGADLPHVLQVMRELCETLAFLHGEGIIHRDIKPANVFLRGGTAPVLMDFGIAWRMPVAVGREVLDLPLPSAGTVEYMAPEQIRGEIMDARADLYAVGCILYQAVTGRVPFGSTADQVVLRGQLFSRPTPPSEVVDDVAPALEDLILRLLEKRPRDRLGHAGDVASALEAIGAPRRPGWEPAPARAYVYRPGLSGREEPMGELTHHLDRLAGGSGGCVLVRGESGIGKTHLCMAVAHAAAARDLEVITGSCAPVVPCATTAADARGGAAARAAFSLNDAPLQAFRPLLRAIVDRCLEGGAGLTREILGHRAKVLAPCEPALAHLPGVQGYAEPPVLPARAARARLLRAIAEVITAFAQKWPLLLVLDDMQWADELSIELLASLPGGYFDRCPALILGTCRSEQIRGRLEELVAMPGITRIDLGKLDEESVAAMVGDMLAMSAPPEPFVRFLSLRSAGNPFFVAEYVRAALAEGLLCRSPAGRWQLARTATGEATYDGLPLPASLGELCGRRLSNLSPAARELMETASVLGRDSDWSLLSEAVAMDDDAAMDAARELVARHILEEAEPGRLRFLHEKLREAAHDRIPAARRAALHAAAAGAIEARAASAADFPLFYAKIARHYTEAGRGGKAIEYLEKAGEHALETCSNREAAGFFGELVARGEEAGLDRTTEEGRLKWGRWERRLAEACSGLGEFGPMMEHAGRALSWAGHPLPVSPSGWVLRLAREVVVQAAHRIAPRPIAAPGSAPRAGAVEASITLAGLAKVYFFCDARRALTAGLWSMNLAERAGGGAKLASVYAVLGLMLGFCRLPGLAWTYFALARGTAERTNDEAGLVFSLYVQGFWLHTQGGEWGVVSSICEEAIEKARRLGDPNEVGSAELILALTELASGRIHESRRRFQALTLGAAQRANGRHVTVGLTCLGSALLKLGEIDEAEARLEEARAGLERREDSQVKATCLGLLATVHARKGHIDKAVAVADIVCSEAEKAPALMGLGTAYGGAAEAYLARLERALKSRPAEIVEARRALRRILPKLLLATRIHPIEGPAYHCIQGRMRWIEGAPARAKRSWERGLAVTVKLNLPYEQAIARIDLARAEPPGSAARERHLDTAEALCVEMGCRSALTEIWALRVGAPAGLN